MKIFKIQQNFRECLKKIYEKLKGFEYVTKVRVQSRKKWVENSTLRGRGVKNR